MRSARKAIIVAAGRGRRLAPYTDEMPKCLVPVAGRPILAWQLEAFAAVGVEEVVIVRGYLADVLTERAPALAGAAGLRVELVDNHEWQTNNILQSLFCAEDHLDDAVYLSYADIIYGPDVTRALAGSPADLALVIDADFADIYEGRTEHPLEEAEVAELDDAGRVRRVGKRALPATDAYGEFIGLARLSTTASGWVRDAWRQLRADYAGREDQPFVRAPAFRIAYLTDLLQHLIDAGRPIHPVTIRGRWREIDTGQDLQRARALLESDQEDWK